MVAKMDKPHNVQALEPNEDYQRKVQQFCLYCGAGIGLWKREGEGTCPKCDPPKGSSSEPGARKGGKANK